MYVKRELHIVIESRASNVIASATNLLEQIDVAFPPEQVEKPSCKLRKPLLAKGKSV
jgi:hypothetical protein